MAKTRFLAAGVACTVLGALLFGACGGDDDAKSDQKSATAEAKSEKSADGATTTGGDQKTAEPTKKADSGGTGGKVVDTILNLMEKGEKANAQISYEVKGGGSDNDFTSWIQAKKNGKTYFSFKSKDGSSSSIIDDGKNTYLCTKPADGEGVCLKSAKSADSLDLSFNRDEVLADFKASASSAKEVGSRKIAGRDARCFEITTDGVKESLCLDKNDGLALFMTGEEIELTATEAKTNVDDKVFEPPYKVQELPTR